MGGATWWTGIAGASRAAELVLLGQTIDAVTALEWGLLNGVVAEQELDEHVARVVTTIERLPEPALARSKAALRRAREAGLDAELVALGAVQGSLLTSAEFRTATARFAGNQVGRGVSFRHRACCKPGSAPGIGEGRTAAPQLRA